MLIIPFSVFVAFRYIRGRSGGLFSINAWLSFIGVFIATALMVIILSIFDGFQQQIKKSIFDFEPHLTIENPLGDGKIHNWKKYQNLIKNKFGNEIASVRGMIQSPALIRVFNQVDYVFLRGREFPQDKQGNWNLPSDFPKIVYPQEMKFLPKGRHCLIGKEMAINFNLQVGESIELVVPRGEFSLRMGVQANRKRFRIAGFFHTGHYEYDSKAVIVSLPVAQQLFLMNDSTQKISVKLHDANRINEMHYKLAPHLPFNYQIKTIENQQKSLFAALALEKVVVSIIISLFIITAMTGLTISTYHSIRTKRRDIGILKAIGISDLQILTIFTLNGLLMGILGTFFGMLFGVYSALKLDSLIKVIESLINGVGHFIASLFANYHWYEIKLISQSVYYFDHIPVSFYNSDLHILAVISLLLAGLASFIPANYARKLQPIDIIRSV